MITDYQKKLMKKQLGKTYDDEIVVYTVEKTGNNYILTSGSDQFYDFFQRADLSTSGTDTISGSFAWSNYANRTYVPSGILERADAIFVTNEDFYYKFTGTQTFVTNDSQELRVVNINKGLDTGQIIIELTKREES